jgi:protein-tyrosine kinase
VSKIFQALERAERERDVHKWRGGEEQGLSPSTGGQPTKRQRQRDVEFDQLPTAETLGSMDPHLVGLLAPTTLEAEQYRTICHRLEQLTKETGLSVLAVSSPTVGDGKTTTAINLAGTLAQFPETKVLLVDLDLRRPSLSQLLGLRDSHSPDVEDVISSQKLALKDAVRHGSTLNLDIIPAKQPLIAFHEILKSQRLGALLQEARQYYNYVIVDTPPLVHFSDCRFLERWIDGFLVVVAAHKTPRKLIEEAIQVVDPDKMIGLVFNNDTRPVRKYYSYYSHLPFQNAEKKGWWLRAIKWFGPSLQRSSR